MLILLLQLLQFLLQSEVVGGLGFEFLILGLDFQKVLLEFVCFFSV